MLHAHRAHRAHRARRAHLRGVQEVSLPLVFFLFLFFLLIFFSSSLFFVPSSFLPRSSFLSKLTKMCSFKQTPCSNDYSRGPCPQVMCERRWAGVSAFIIACATLLLPHSNSSAILPLTTQLLAFSPNIAQVPRNPKGEGVKVARPHPRFIGSCPPLPPLRPPTVPPPILLSAYHHSR